MPATAVVGVIAPELAIMAGLAHQAVAVVCVAVVLLVLHCLPRAGLRALRHRAAHKREHLLHAAALEEPKGRQICGQAKQQGLLLAVPFQDRHGCELHPGRPPAPVGSAPAGRSLQG